MICLSHLVRKIKTVKATMLQSGFIKVDLNLPSHLVSEWRYSENQKSMK